MAAASAAWPSATSPGWSRAPDPARAAAWTPRPARRAVTRLPRTLRLDPSDTVVFERAAEPGEWAVPGGFAFWDEDPAALTGRRRQEFRAGFLGLGSFGWSTLVEVAEAAPAERAAAVEALAARILQAYGAPGPEAARAAAEEEVAFAESLCGHPTGTVLALARSVE